MIRRALLAATVLLSAAASARSSGINTPVCYGCHSGGQAPIVSISANPSVVSPGGTVTLTVTIQAVNGSVGGIYLRSSGVGAFSLISGQNTRLINANEVVHSAPKSATGGNVTFLVSWTAPSSPGGVDLTVSALSGNGNGASSGDNYAEATLNLVWGCSGSTYYRDLDLDGVGSAQSGTTRNCSAPAGYSASNGDCNDNDEQVFPGHAEVCNGRDDNCNGQSDEGLPVITAYPDGDKDGYGRNGTTMTGCAAPAGYAINNTDCDDTDVKTYPGAQETCDLKDNNCDGQVDEGARVICGVGMCRRYGPTCDLAQCQPGQPTAEICNGLDDDCDGVDDNGSHLCPSGQSCVNAVCTGSISGAGGGVGAVITDGGSTKQPEPSGGCSVAAGLPGAIALLIVLRRLQRRR